jgi:hypothetical protein
VAGEFEGGQRSCGTVGGGTEGEDCVVAPVYDLASVTFQEDFTDELGARV